MELFANHLNDVLVLAIFAVSFNLLSGYAGQFSVAHAAFGAVGGYTLAYVVVNGDGGFVVGTLLGVALATVSGVVVGLSVIRLTSEWLMLLTFGVLMVVVSVASTSTELGGTYGIQGVSDLELFGYALDRPTKVLPVFLVLTAVVFAVCHRFGESPYGRVLRAIRDDEVATRALGKNVTTYKLTTFAITSGMAGLGGVLMVVQTTLASPATFNLALAVLIVSAVVIGGSGNLVGSLLGAALIVLLTPFLDDVVKINPGTAPLWQLVVYGTMLIAVLFWRPQGVLPEGARLRGRRRSAPEHDLGRSGSTTAGPRRAVAPDSSSGPLLQVAGLSKRFGGVVAADDLEFTLERGAISALVGPNGAGKTTLFNLLTGAIRPDRGSIALNGREIVGLGPDRIARLGMVRTFQDVRVFPRLSVLDNVVLATPGHDGERAGSLLARPRRVRAHERSARALAYGWLEVVGLEGHAADRVGDLPFGEQKLVALARALATEADVLLLDEPASGIDARWLDPIINMVRDARDAGRTICIVEHNLEVVERIADDIAFMELGRITARGTFSELIAEPRLAEAYFGT